MEHNAPIEKTTLSELRGKGYGFASRIESIDFQEMNMAFGKHAKRQKLEGQEQGSGSKGLEKICGDTLASDNSDNGGINKDLRHEDFEKILDKTFGKDSANERKTLCKKEATQIEKFSNRIVSTKMKTMTRMAKNAKLCH